MHAPIFTRIKICGITRLEDALAASALGTDALGFVFYAPSPRAVTTAQAQTIIRQLPPFITKVGLFVDAEEAFIHAVLTEVSLDILQFHGEESPADCQRYDKPYLKAIRMRPGVDLPALMTQYSEASALLLDTYVEGVPGGTGLAFNWDCIPAKLAKPIILAGGLTPANVGTAVAAVQPYAVDVSGGVESAKGIKDYAKMQAFITRIKSLQASLYGADHPSAPWH